jgi:hypothetical protein
MSNRSWHLLTFCFFAALVFFAKLPILDVPHYWDEMAWVSQGRWLSEGSLLRALPGLRAPDAFWGHPPGLHLTLASLVKIFGYSIVLSHLIPVCFAFIGVWFTFLLGRLLYDTKTGFFAALFLFLSSMYFAQSGMFLADVPVAALGVTSVYFALRRHFFAYFLSATYMVFIKETSIALLVALLLYLFFTARPMTNEKLTVLVKYSVPLLLIGFFFIWQKFATGYFFFIYAPTFDIKLLDLTPRLISNRFGTITGSLFIYQHSYIFSSLLALNLIVKRTSRRRPELWLFFLICLFSGYSFVVLFFLPRYLLPVLPYLCLLGAWSLMELVKSPAWNIPAAIVLLSGLVWSLATQPFTDNAELNLRYLDVVRVHKEMCEFIASEFPHSRTLTAWPHDRQLLQPHLGYVKKPLRVVSPPGKDLSPTWLKDQPVLREVDLIFVSTTPVTFGMEELRHYALKHNWRLIRRLADEPITSELYGRRN